MDSLKVDSNERIWKAKVYMNEMKTFDVLCASNLHYILLVSIVELRN